MTLLYTLNIPFYPVVFPYGENVEYRRIADEKVQRREQPTKKPLIPGQSRGDTLFPWELEEG